MVASTIPTNQSSSTTPSSAAAYVEHVHAFGPDDSLVGIVTLPAGPNGPAAAKKNSPFVILLNAGLVHRAGPFRMAVEIARDLAARGHRVLRLDQSGLGDSLPNPKRLPIEEQILIDGKAAIELLSSRYGASSFAVAGLCAGAMNAHRLALGDSRIQAVCMFDGYAYPTRRYYEHILRGWIRKRKSWRGMSLRALARARATIKAKLRARQSSAAAAQTEQPVLNERQAIFYQDWPDAKVAQAELEQLLDRKIQMLFIYTGGWSSFVDERQFDEMFPRLRNRSRVTVRYYPEADHTFIHLADRRAMLRDVGDFLDALGALGAQQKT